MTLPVLNEYHGEELAHSNLFPKCISGYQVQYDSFFLHLNILIKDI